MSGSDLDSRQWISSLSEGQRVDEVYLVWRKNKLMARNSRPYLALQVGDRTGRIEARAWERADELDARFGVHDLVRVRAQVVRYQDHLQLKVDDIVAVSSQPGTGSGARADGQPGAVIDMEIFLPSSSRSVDTMWVELFDLVAGLPDPHLRGLLQDLLSEPDVAARIKAAPAAKNIHHAWRGGLLEHTLSVCGLVQALWRHYEQQLPGLLDRSLLVAGAIIHDMGKVWEMDPVTFEYTDEGRLLGHMPLMLVELDRRIRARPDFPRTLTLHLEHLLLSHHGELEYGSPKRPKTPEAWVLHYADILDGRMMWMHSLFADMDPGDWSAYQRLYDRYFWKPPRTAFPDIAVEGETTGAPDLESNSADVPASRDEASGGIAGAETFGNGAPGQGGTEVRGGREEVAGDRGRGKKKGKKEGAGAIPLLPGLAVPGDGEGPEQGDD